MSVIISGNFTAYDSWGGGGILYFPWRPQMSWLQLQIFSRCRVGIYYCNVIY